MVSTPLLVQGDARALPLRDASVDLRLAPGQAPLFDGTG